MILLSAEHLVTSVKRKDSIDIVCKASHKWGIKPILLSRPGLESRKKVSQGLKDHLVRLYSQASRFRRMLESEARKVNYLFPEEATISTYDQHVKRLEHFRLSPAPRSPPKPGRRPRFWMIWFLAGVAAAASMVLTIYARLEYLKMKN